MEKNLEFVRIDDRLIHGQVVASWLHAYSNVEKIMIVDDKTSTDPFMQDMFSLLVPTGIEINIYNITNAIAKIKVNISIFFNLTTPLNVYMTFYIK